MCTEDQTLNTGGISTRSPSKQLLLILTSKWREIEEFINEFTCCCVCLDRLQTRDLSSAKQQID